MALSIIGTPTAAVATSLTLPTHAVGDIIIFYAYRNSVTAMTKPTAGGTVPTWIDIQHPSGNTSQGWATYAVATATNHTSGTWTGASRVGAIVLRGQAASPIGGNASATGSVTNSATAPAVTLVNTDGSSMLLHFYGVQPSGTLGSAPAGYTRRFTSDTATGQILCLNTKDSTTTDGAIAQTHTGTNGNYSTVSVEIKAPATVAANTGAFFAMF